MRALFKFAKPRSSAAEPAQASPLELKEAQLAAAFYGQRTGGDLHDYIRVGPSRTLFALLDVAGRLDQNRVIVAAAQSAFRACGQRLLAKDDANEADAMIEICVQMNRAILKAAERVCSCAAFAGCYNESLGTVCYVNAGHTPALLRDRTGVIELGATGLPLGLFSHSAADASMVALEPGATLLLVSRGLVEANRKSKEFGLAPVKELLSAPAQTAEEICASLLGQVRHFLAPKFPENDITVLALARSAATKVTAPGGANGPSLA
jgi:sigma-B regulation protein RsbU (phosphoserine phosphatase)